jgi:hypothetical protein
MIILCRWGRVANGSTRICLLLSAMIHLHAEPELSSARKSFTIHHHRDLIPKRARLPLSGTGHSPDNRQHDPPMAVDNTLTVDGKTAEYSL